MNFLPLVLAAVVATSTPPREWRDSIRDVYIDGKLERSAQTLMTSSPRMIAVVCGDEVLLLDPETQEVSRAAKSELSFNADRTVATSAALVAAKKSGSLTKAGTTFLTILDGKSVLVAPHASKAGAMTIDELWETAPVWRAVAETYQPDSALVARLRAIDQPVTLDVVLATWCGDSRQYVPRLLKSIREAGNPRIKVQLIGIDADFLQPANVIAGENITNVPTVIVRRGEREIGRFVETPAGATIEDDVCDIVAGTPKPHPGRIERGPLVASGTYILRDAKQRREGTETFAIYQRAAGGFIAHSVIARNDGTSIETWASPQFVEVTERSGLTTRTRYRRTGDVWTAHSRGATGIVDQTVLAPAEFISPATVTYAWARTARSVYAVPESGVGVVRAHGARIAEGEVPRFVKMADGSSRELVTPR